MSPNPKDYDFSNEKLPSVIKIYPEHMKTPQSKQTTTVGATTTTKKH
eukprot:CAMPEP_0116870792 /NCGR_PEP_ID=MMETSP0463-20121206/868_1 /TAXON_ID=181622 /ORGANISM="Strombidinopsis sp, Strain SopsisLIS2011" /LENGTH=46 /DNA_ID= /DNA_START= /DNA_END= /DNA_ORIENTATION=